MAITKAADLLQEMIDSQWKEIIARLKQENMEGKAASEIVIRNGVTEDLLSAPYFREQLLVAGYDVHLSKKDIIRAISWKNAMPDRRGKEIYPEDEAVHLEGGSSECGQKPQLIDQRPKKVQIHYELDFFGFYNSNYIPYFK